jgi:hypothetical protein
MDEHRQSFAEHGELLFRKRQFHKRVGAKYGDFIKASLSDFGDASGIL